MLSKLILSGVGPAKRLEAEFSQRLNLITGDNGVGKSFLLDLAWWMLVGRWPRSAGQVSPHRDVPDIFVEAVVDGDIRPMLNFDIPSQEWRNIGHENYDELVIYAQVDGGFAVCDPARRSSSDAKRSQNSTFLFRPRQVWDGLEDDGVTRCNGLYRDWASWQRENNEAFGQLNRALLALSPPKEELRPGPLTRISVEDVRDYPAIHMPYGIAAPSSSRFFLEKQGALAVRHR